MGNENGEWVIHGLSARDKNALQTADELLEYVERVGFLPLFYNELPGFSVEEHTIAVHWWSDDEAVDPWSWRQVLARSHKVAYGKFFNKKAGFISLKWLPYFANARRDGYDFDARWDDGKASYRAKHIMDRFPGNEEILSFALKEEAGFGKDGEKNFEGALTDLQMQTYLTVSDFRQRLNKKGQPYGWHIAAYSTPESLWGYDLLTGAYGEPPEMSRERIYRHAEELCPGAGRKDIIKVLK